MKFRSIADLNRDVLANLHRLPADIDVVVGIPRSGMLAASLIALARNLPLADIDGFANGRIFESGSTRRHAGLDRGFGQIRHALIVDDSSRTGNAMRKARARLAGLEGVRCTYCVAYGVADLPDVVDLSLAEVAEPRIFEWNVIHHPLIGRACVDIDGVLCHDPLESDNDDGEAYRNFLRTARPLNIPTHAIGTLVTSRLEKYRPETEAWLAANGVRYAKLEMLDAPDAETRRRLRMHAPFKAEVYRRADSPLFIESELGQAHEIARLSGKPVLCMEGPVLVTPDALAVALRQGVRSRKGAKALARRVLGDGGYRRLRDLVSGARGGGSGQRRTA